MRRLFRWLIWGPVFGLSALGAVAAVALSGAQVLPPGLDADCADQVPIVVASDAAAQSDLYSAATLAGALDTTCIVLAGGRDAEVDPAQLARLDASRAGANSGANSGASSADDSGPTSAAGYIVGGEGAVPPAKLAAYPGLTRIGGQDRWHTARLVGAVAVDPDGDIDALTAATAPQTTATGSETAASGGTSVIVDGAEVLLPPGLDASCVGQVRIVVASDAAAQSDLYSAATLAGVLETSCFVLAGARGVLMEGTQLARLVGAESGGYIVGGEGAVRPGKVLGYGEFTRIDGEDRWHTARLVGELAVKLAQRERAAATTTTLAQRSAGGGSGGRVSAGSPTGSGSRVSSGRPASGGSRTPAGTTTTSVPPTTTTSEPPPPTTTTSEPPPPTTTTSEPPPPTSTTPEPPPTTTTTTEPPPPTTTTTTEPPAPEPMASTFVPSVSVSVPLLDGVTAGVNIWSGERLVVTIGRASTPASGAPASGEPDANCSLASPVSVTYVVSADGSLEVEGSMVDGAVVPSMLVDTTADQFTCEYTVTFADAPVPDVNAELSWMMTAPAAATLSAANASVSGGYTVGVVTFDPDPVMAVPAGYAGEQFEIAFASSSAGCVDQTLTYTIQSDDTVAPDAANASLVAYPAPASPAASSAPGSAASPPPASPAALCSYSFAFPQTEVGGTALALQPTPAPSTTVTGQMQTISASYASTFVPSVSVSVPLLDGVTAGSNIWSGERLVVTIGRASTPAAGEPGSGAPASGDPASGDPGAACSLASPVSVTYVVSADGSLEVEGSMADSAVVPSVLIDTTADQFTCEYTVTFSDAPVPDVNAELSWMMTAPPAATLSAANASVSGGYTVGVVMFDPDPAIAVPAGYAGEQFEIAFTSSSAGCVDQTLTYTIQPDDTVAPDAANASLVAYPAPAAPAPGSAASPAAGSPGAAPAASPAALCSYTFAFPATEVGGTALALQLTPAPSTSVTGQMQTIAASYASTFVPSVSVSVPLLDGVTAGSNIWSGERLVVTIGRASTPASGDPGSGDPASGAPASGEPDANCSLASPVSVTYVVQADGSLMVEGPMVEGSMVDGAVVPSMLVDTTADQFTCEYTVTFSDAPVSAANAELSWMMTAPAAATLSGSSTNAPGGYTVGVVTFDPDPTITVPAGYPGEQFEIAFAGSSAGCVDQTLTYTIQPDDTVAAEAANASLVAYPAPAASSAELCSYTFAFPQTEVGGTALALQPTPAPSTTVTGQMQTITATYAVPQPRGSVLSEATAGAVAFTTVTAGFDHACTLQEDGTVTCWGDNRYGQLDAPPGAFKWLSAGKYFTCGVRSDGDADGIVQCWGNDDEGQASPPEPGPPEPSPPESSAPAGSSFTQVAAGTSHACGLKTDGTVECWGAGAFTHAPDDTFTSLSAGEWHTCGVRSGGDTDGTAVCWGAALGTEIGGVPTDATLTAIAAGEFFTCWLLAEDGTLGCAGLDRSRRTRPPSGAFTALTTGVNHACALAADGSVECWGEDDSAQTEVPDGSFAAVSAGGAHTCGVLTEGSVVCWGYSNFGQANPPSDTFTALAAGSQHSCGVRTGGSVVCWGDDGSRRTFPDGTSYTQVAAGGAHTCGVLTSGAIDCWGHDIDGQAVDQSGSFTSVSVGITHSCGLLASGTVRCWGSNNDGRRTVPAGTYTALSVGDAHSCGVHPGGRVTCWGNSGDGRTNAPSGTFTAVSAGALHTCGLRANAAIRCWGSNADRQRAAPSGSYKAVAAGGRHTCAIRSGGDTDGQLVCWGDNSSGQIDAPSGTFTAVVSGRQHTCALRADSRALCWGAGRQWSSFRGSLVAVSTGTGHSCGLRSSGAVLCWGDNRRGQTAAPSGAFKSVSAGKSHSCGVRDGGTTDGRLVCWGDDGSGQANPPAERAFVSVAAGSAHSCGLKTDGTVECWGIDNAISDPPAGTFSSLSVGDQHSCGLKTDGTAACWGFEFGGEIRNVPAAELTAISAGEWFTCWVLAEDGTLGCAGLERSRRTMPPAGSSFVDVVAGVNHACALAADDSVECWGDDDFAQIDAPDGPFIAVAAGGRQTCAVRTDETIACWGYGNYGQATPPTGTFDSVAAGGEHSCGVRTGGSVVCWGNDGSRRTFPDSSSYTQVAAGGAHTCGVLTSGAIDCWGGNIDGQAEDQSGSFTSVSVGISHSCGLLASGGARCWGSNRDNRRTAPAGTYRAVSAGNAHSCGVYIGGQAICWGDDGEGRASAPGDLFTTVSAGGRHTCGIRVNATIKCWGSNGVGQRAAPSGSFKAIAAGSEHTCAIRSDDDTDGQLVCWGENSDGQTEAPTGQFSSVSAGAFHSCAVRSGGDADGTTVCWGAGEQWRTLT